MSDAPYLSTMESLPNELLDLIATHLDSEAPSSVKFAHDTSTHLSESDTTPLKLLSLVSRRWRKIVLPFLFRHSRIALDTEPQWVALNAQLEPSMLTQLSKLSDHELEIYFKLRNKVKSGSLSAYAESRATPPICRVQDGDEFLKTVPDMLWLPHLSTTFEGFARFVTQCDLKHHIKSVVVYTDKAYELRFMHTADAALERTVADIWCKIFRHLEPTRIVVAAPPATLAALLESQMECSDIWASSMKMHYMELIQPEPLRLKHMQSDARFTNNSALIHQRPWSHFGYNEGDSMTAYNSWYHHCQMPPKTFSKILERLANEVQPCCNITSFSATGVFPFGKASEEVVAVLAKIPTLKLMTFQFTPGPESNALEDPERIGKNRIGDFWYECQANYNAIRFCFRHYEFNHGTILRSRDCRNEQLAQYVAGQMERLRQRGVGWKKSTEEEGVWIRDSTLDWDLTPMTARGII